MELKSGPSLALYEAARAVLGDVPFRFSPYSKAERGYRFAEGREAESPAPRFADDISFSAGASTERAFRDVLRSCLTQICENRLAVLASEDPEGPHQLGEAGALRDLDVLIDEIVMPVVAKAPQNLSFDALLAELSATRGEDTRKVLTDHLKSAEVNTFLLDLAAYTEGRGWLDPENLGQTALLAQPIEEFAGNALARQWKKVLKYGKRIEDLSVPERHEMRKAMKKMRYGIEFFGSLYPVDTVKPFLKRMKKLQDIFGYLNDVAMAETLPDKYNASGRSLGPGADAVLLATGFVIGWHEAQCQAMWQHARGYWDATRRTPKFWV